MGEPPRVRVHGLPGAQFVADVEGVQADVAAVVRGHGRDPAVPGDVGGLVGLLAELHVGEPLHGERGLSVGDLHERDLRTAGVCADLRRRGELRVERGLRVGPVPGG